MGAAFRYKPRNGKRGHMADWAVGEAYKMVAMDEYFAGTEWVTSARYGY
jgi:hypothetical protein